MIFTKEYVAYLARNIVKKLISGEFIEAEKPAEVTERVTNAMVDELSIEDRINDEVRAILEAYSTEMQKTGANYQEMFKKVKNELVRKYRAVLTTPQREKTIGPRGMRVQTEEPKGSARVAEEKVNKLAHVISDTLAAMDSVEFLEDRNGIRLEAKRLLQELLKEEAKIDAEARRKIESQKRTILEGTPEWDILYKKYYAEEVKKLGI
jgi:uncharacterized protein